MRVVLLCLIQLERLSLNEHMLLRVWFLCRNCTGLTIRLLLFAFAEWHLHLLPVFVSFDTTTSVRLLHVARENEVEHKRD